jgi:hypothetical protein
MGQKSNINSIRPFLSQPNFSNQNIKMNLLEINFSKNLIFLLKTKGIQISNSTLGFTNNKIFICFHVFFSTQKIIKFRKYKQIFCVQDNIKINKIFTKLSGFVKNPIVDIKIININKQIDKNLAKPIFLIYKKYVNSLFDKKFYLCLDITKITVLFLLNKIETKAFLDYVGKSFCSIHKKNHVRYFKLISNIFNFIVFKNAKNNPIFGLKLQISGKLKGKAMASQQLIACGSMPTQTLNKNITFGKMHVYTTYGVFGFKLWVHRKQ